MTCLRADKIAIVAIARNELRFIDEWILYHKLIGVDGFVVFDDDPEPKLKGHLSAYSSNVKVIEWHGQSECLPGRNRQTKAYWHAVLDLRGSFDWVGFLDIDEFLVLKKHSNVHDLLSEHADSECVSFNWNVFGHNGFYDDPEDIVIASLTRRMAKTSAMTKFFARPETIQWIDSAHVPLLANRLRNVDPNGRPVDGTVYAGIADIANINHYQCRSFKRWIERPSRGDVTLTKPVNAKHPDHWRLDSEACLRKFVETVALDKNEVVDTYMLRYAEEVRGAVLSLKNRNLESNNFLRCG